MTDQLLGLRQPDQRSCGPACLVAARMLLEPAYAASLAGQRFGAEVLALHRQVVGHRDTRGALQAPWPRLLGTPPWAVARQLSVLDTHRDYAARLVVCRACAFDRLSRPEAPSALYVGNRWLPRHVVLVVERAPFSLQVYEPSRGVMVTVTRAAFLAGRLGLAGWDRPWFTVAAP